MDTFLKISKSPKLVILAKMLILHFTVAVRACVAFLAKLRFFGDFWGLEHFGQIFETYGKEGIFDIFLIKILAKNSPHGNFLRYMSQNTQICERTYGHSPETHFGGCKNYKNYKK